ncbi:hypothetical protein [Archangium sp.]|uniref:hypothetical protein n=1 Tax=Archangium sp. TaxID=1872627 RepID=UPI002D3B5389|nr:hypothetical protein [Archangium sp.]HYO56129.1 hypothetical protein [Archangium sp.]
MRLAITGVGMVTAVGYGAAGSCAAIRAGISRPRELEDFTIADGEGGSHAVVGHPVTGFAEGFCQVGAWVRLAAGGLEDLRHVVRLPEPGEVGFWRRTGLMALAPVVDPERFSWSLEEQPDALLEEYARPLARLARFPIADEHIRSLGMGHCGLAVALQQARALLSERRLERVVIVGADSYVDPGSLEWLHQGNRLKGPQKQTGLMPGEAGASVMVESEHSARGRSAPLGGQVRAVAVSAEHVFPRAPPPVLGRALAAVIQQCLEEARATTPFRGYLMLDLNGEDWKAHAWGHAMIHLTASIDFERCRTLLPCESLGELGAASGPVAFGLAVSELLRARSDAGALLCSLSDSGQVAAVLLARF